MAPIVYDGVPQTQTPQNSANNLFGNQRFFVSQRVPDRKHLLGIIIANGGDVVDLEKQADVIIVDHARKNEVRAGTHSWRYITESVKNGKLEELDDHRVGTMNPSERPIGTTSIAAKSSRRPFTTGDDKVLWKWVKTAETKGLSTKGNEIYKSLADEYRHHTWQSWRDRWLKYVCRNNWPIPIGSTSDGAEDSPPIQSFRTETRRPNPRSDKSFRASNMPLKKDPSGGNREIDEMVDTLVTAAGRILSFSSKQEKEYWEQFHVEHPLIPIATLKDFFHGKIAPLHQKKAEWEQLPSTSHIKNGSSLNVSKTTDSNRQSNNNPRERSPSWQPQSSISPRQVLERLQAPSNPNKPPARPLGNSRKSAPASETSDSEVGEIPYSSANRRLKRKRDEESRYSQDGSRSTRDISSPIRTVRSKSRKERPLSPEIPSTPDPAPMAEDSLPQTHPDMTPRRSPSNLNGVQRIVSSPINVRLLSDDRGSSPANMNGSIKHSAPREPHGTQNTSQSIQEWVQGTADSDDGLETDDDPYETAPVNVIETFETAPEAHSTRLETQALFNGHIQEHFNELDFGVPEPEGGWDNVNSEPAKLDKVPAAKPKHPAYTSPSAWFEHRVRTTPNASAELLLSALECITTGTHHTPSDLELADLVYDALRKGEGIPDDVPGAWTEQDDAALLGSHAKRMEDLRAKHGDAAVNARWEVLGVKMDG